jgi:secretion/DNA translocation related TadE-like protein
VIARIPARRCPGATARDRGSGTVLVLGLIGVVVVLIGVVTTVGTVVVARHRAESAADLAALAAAGATSTGTVAAGVDDVSSTGCSRAAAVAFAAGALLTSCSRLADGSVVVQVGVVIGARPASPGGALIARARARAGVGPSTAG